jgi:hypothetical protein
MRVREQFVLPEHLRDSERKARRLEYWSIFFLLTITALMFYVMGSSQAMKTAWIEDVLSMIPPIVYLIASHERTRCRQRANTSYAASRMGRGTSHRTPRVRHGPPNQATIRKAASLRTETRVPPCVPASMSTIES